MKKQLIRLMLIMMMWGSPLFAQPITFAVTPQESPLTLVKKWGPVVDTSPQKRGCRLNFVQQKILPRSCKK